MKKFILILLVSVMVIACFSGCDILDGGSDGEQKEIKVVDKMDSELNSIFAKIQDDFKDDSRFIFYESFQEAHYEYKNSEKYADKDWTPSHFSITIKYDIEKVQEAEWYKNAVDKDTKALNKEFYNYYSDIFKNSSLHTGLAGRHGFIVSYSGKTNEEFMEDFNQIHSIVELEYVTLVMVYYEYGVPSSTILEGMEG